MSQVKQSVVIYRDHLLNPSETFILRQAAALNTYRPVFAGARRVPGLDVTPFESYVANSGGKFGVIPEAIFRIGKRLPPGLRPLRKSNAVLVHAHFGPSGVAGMQLADSLNVPFVVTYHGFDVTTSDEALLELGQGPRAFVRRRQEIFNRAGLHICISDYLRERLVALGAPPHRTVRHYVGVDLSTFHPDESVEREDFALFVGRLAEVKGCGFAIDAIARANAKGASLKLVVVGAGVLREQLEVQARKVNVDCQFLGTRPQSEVVDLMRRARLLIAPSIEAKTGAVEGFGLALVEAQAVGTPVVGFASGGIPEAVEHGVTGLLASPYSVEELAEAVLTVCTDDAAWESFSRKGVSRTKARFGIETQTKSLEALYRSVIDQHPNS